MVEAVLADCRACGVELGVKAHEAHERMFGTGEPFLYRECEACGTLQIDSVPMDLGRHYPTGYYSMRPRTAPRPRSALKRWAIAEYTMLQVRDPQGLASQAIAAILPAPDEWVQLGKYLAHSGLRSRDDPILDVGCGGYPHRLMALQRLGFRSTLGIDPYIEADREHEGVRVLKRDIEQCEGSFAWIMFHHSLEHVPDPVTALRSAARLLRPGGRCLVRVPIVGGWLWRRFGTAWVEFDAPRHLHLFSPQGVAAAAERAGLEVEHCRHESEGWEIAWSEAYRRNVPMHGPDARKPEELFDAETLARFEVQADVLNRLHDAGRAAFVLKKC